MFIRKALIVYLLLETRTQPEATVLGEWIVDWRWLLGE
jgi:hypothetical protein